MVEAIRKTRQDAEDPKRDHQVGIDMLRGWLRGLHINVVIGHDAAQDMGQDEIAERLGEYPRGHERFAKIDPGLSVAPRQSLKIDPRSVLHPGETITEYLSAHGWSQSDLAQRTGITPTTISDLCNGKAPISTAIALRLEDVFGRPAHLWTNLQQRYDDAQVRMKQEDQDSDVAFSSALREVLGPRAEEFSEELRNTLHEFFSRGVTYGRQD